MNMNCFWNPSDMQTIQVIIPTYNRQSTIVKCIASVLSQKHDLNLKIKIDVIENNSSDCTCELISSTYQREVKDGLLVIHKFDETVPIIENWNRFSVILSPETAIIKFLWSDDYLDPSYFAATVPVLNSGFDAVGCDVQYINNSGHKLSIRRYSDAFWALLVSPFYKNLVGCPSSLLLRRSSFDHIFNCDNRYAADLEHFLDGIFQRRSQYKLVSQVLVNVTLNAGTETNSLFGSNVMIDNKINFSRHAAKTYFNWTSFGSVLCASYAVILKLRFRYLKRFFNDNV